MLTANGLQTTASGSQLAVDTQPYLFTNIFSSILNQFKKIGVVFEEGIVRAKEFIAEKITAKELCLEDVCVNKEQLKALLEKNQISPIEEPVTATPSPTPSPSPEPAPEPTPEASASPTPEPSATPEVSESPIPEPTPIEESLIIEPLAAPEPSLLESLSPSPAPELAPETEAEISQEPAEEIITEE